MSRTKILRECQIAEASAQRPEPVMQLTQWWDSLFASIDAKQTIAFAAMLCEDAVFRYGSGPEVHGRAAIAACVEQVFATFRSCSHRVLRRWEIEDMRICHGIVTYTRLDGREVPLPFCNLMTMREDLVARYEIYVDPGPLFAK
jgi:ketosteroid isomerase-like protein